jgi:4-amino-4-deoxy-L-arabinose transferase-like glycosyltransferase
MLEAIMRLFSERNARIWRAIGFGALVLFSSYILFYKLGTEALQDYDEATYAQVTYESVAQGNPATLTFLHQPYFRKPPLLFWMTSASSRVFTDSEFAMRFPSALSGMLAALVVILICVEAGASVPFALFGGAVLATTASWMEFARDVRFDNLVSLFIATTFYAGIRAARDARWYVVVGIFLALAVLSKSVMAVFAGVALLAYVLFARGWKDSFSLLKNTYVWLGIGAFLMITAPWHIYETIQYGAAFWHSYLGTEVIERATVNLFPGGTNPTNAEYVGYIFQFAAPWTEVFLGAVALAAVVCKRMTRSVQCVVFASIVTVFSVLTVMFIAGTKAYGYLMPMYPFIAVVIALVAAEVWKWLGVARGGSQKKWWRAGFACALVLLTLYAAQQTRFNALHINPYYGSEISQAQEEKDIGLILRKENNPVVYTYDYDALGTVMYYSQLPETANPLVLLWSASSTPSQNTYILATSARSIANAFPHQRFTTVYSGTFVSLFTLAD